MAAKEHLPEEREPTETPLSVWQDLKAKIDSHIYVNNEETWSELVKEVQGFV